MKSLPQNKGVLLEEPEYFGPRCFSEKAVARFPELSAQLTHEAGNIHGQICTLASAARAAFESADTALLSRVFEFLAEILARQRLHPEIENAVAISFLEPAEFEQSDAGRRAWLLLPERLKRILRSAA